MLATLVPGYRLDDRYELLYPYAQGGMATVWAARISGKHGFEKIVAVKTILPHLSREESFRTMFLDEARIAARIRHPNVADIDDLGEQAGTLYMVLEWVDGDSLARLHDAALRAREPFPLPILLRLLADTCAGLHAAHELRDETGHLLGVVHRDVSPQNVLVTTGGAVKVIDFGIAKAVDRLSEQTKTGYVKGKVEYVAPEQVMRRRVDRRADVWAIGTILYQYLAGRLPFEAEGELATLRLLTSGRPPRPLPPTVPAAVAEIVMRALSFSPEARFKTALELERALEAAMPEPVGPPEVAAFVKKHLRERIESRRKALAEALRESAERRGEGGSRDRASLPPEAVPLATPAGARPVVPGPTAPLVEGVETSGTGRVELPTRIRGPALSRGHIALVLVATAVLLGVWSAVVVVVLTSPKLSPVKDRAPAAAPPR
jgi:serine/threonine protein kinase